MSKLSESLATKIAQSKAESFRLGRTVLQMVVTELEENESELARLREAIEKHKEVTTRMDWITDADRELHDALKETTVG